MNTFQVTQINGLLRWWLAQVNTVQWQDSLQKSRVLWVEECQKESIIYVEDWRSANKLSVIVWCFTTQSVDNRFEISQQLLPNLFKINQKQTWKGVGKRSQSPTGSGSARRLQEDESHGSWPPWRPLPWVPFEGSKRPRSVPQGVFD